MKSPQVFGKYLLLERISVGGMAEIFIAKAFGVEGFERILAIKKILPTMAEDLEFITMFIDEARISSQLNHANVVTIHELGKYDEAYYIAMEHVQGLDLRAIAELYRRERQAMPVPMAAYIVSKICEGLDYAHRAKDGRGQELNIVHRDVSPQNVLISFEGEVKIIDFGIAKATNRSQQTQVGILKGKFGYMSPEQALGKPIDRRSDLFAVGVILYELLTGDRLFVGESDFSVVEKVRNADVASPREMNPEIPKALERVILKALSRDQHERYQWCSELQEDLSRFLITEGSLYSTKHLSAFMKEAFADDMQRELEAMERYAHVKRPDDLEDSNVAVSPRKKISRQIPAVGPSAPRLTPSKGIPSGGAAPGRRPSDPAVPRVGREPSRPDTGRKATPAARRPATPAPQPPPAADRTQIIDASHLQETPVEEQPTNVKTQHPPKGKVVIGDKAVHGPTVIGAVPESRSKPAARRNAPPIDAPPSVVVDAGLGLDGPDGVPEDTGAYERPAGLDDEEPRTQGVESYAFGEEAPEHTPVAAAPGEDDDAPPPWPSMEGRGETVVGPAPTAPPKRVSSLAKESNRRRAEAAAAEAASASSVIVGGARLEDSDERTPASEDAPEQTSPLETSAVEAAAAEAAESDTAAFETAAFEAAASGAEGSEAAASDAAESEAAASETGAFENAAAEAEEADTAASGAPASDSDEAPDSGASDSEASDTAAFETAALAAAEKQTAAEEAEALEAANSQEPEAEAGAAADANGFEDAPATAEMEALAAASAEDAAPALGDTEAAPSTGSATQLANPTPLSAADELDALMGADPSAAPFQLRDGGELDEEATSSQAGASPLEFQSEDPAAEPQAASHEDAEEEDEEDAKTAAYEAPSLAAIEQAVSQASSVVVDEEAHHEAEAGSSDEESGGYVGHDRTAAIPVSPELEEAASDEAEEGYEGHDRTAGTAAPASLMDAAEDEEGYTGQDRTAAIPAPSHLAEDEDEQEALATDSGVGRAAHDDDERYDDEELESRPGETGITEAPEQAFDEDEEDEEEEPEDEATRPERSPRRTPANRSPLAGLTGKKRAIVLGSAGAGLFLVTILLALVLGGGDPGGALMVLTDPPTARITLDGQEVKGGEVVTGLEPGPHALVVAAPGYVTHQVTLKVSGSQTTTQVKLEKEAPPEPVAAAQAAPEEAAPAQEESQAPDAGLTGETAQASADGTGDDADTVTAKATEPVPEPREVEKPKEVAVAAPVVREPRKPEIRQSRTTRRRTGKLAITSSPKGAEIFLNGRSTGRRTPVAFGNALTVTAGTNMLVLKANGMKFVQEIEIRADEMNIVRNAVLK